MRRYTYNPLIVVWLNVAAVLGTSSVGQCQVQTSQTFSVRVPPKFAVTAPAPQVTTRYDGSAPDATFATQRWSVTTNAQSGATVSFSTTEAFTHADRPEFKRDAMLDLAIHPTAGGAEWTIAVPSDRTYHAGGEARERATVRAVSGGPGHGAFDLTVTFLADPAEMLEPGEYNLTLVGTLTAN